ncbi:MAG: hypothetical protein MMC23_008224 [Stictis urceolatum]|nr:hypothetical protein [Stictis urceolata]
MPTPQHSRHASTDKAAPSLLPSALPKHGSITRLAKSSKPSSSRPSSSQSAVHSKHLQPAGTEHSAEASVVEVEPGESSAEAEFEPFFALVEDAHSSTAYHPAVHYIFSDDDGDVLNDTLLRIPSEQLQSGQKERYVVADLAGDGKTVTSAQSLTSDWQVLGAEVSAAPTLEGGEGETGGLMLRLNGTEGIREDMGGQGEGDIEGTIEKFRERMEELKRVLEGGKQSLP